MDKVGLTRFGDLDFLSKNLDPISFFERSFPDSKLFFLGKAYFGKADSKVPDPYFS